MNAELDTTFVKVCDLEDLAVGTPALADVDGIPMALVRTAPDEVHAVNDVCTHANVSLSEGELDGCTLECWLHGSRFDLRTGTPSGPPATNPRWKGHIVVSTPRPSSAAQTTGLC